MICKKPYIVPIPGSRKSERIRENMDASDIELEVEEVAAMDEKLYNLKMSALYGAASKIKRKSKGD